MEDRIRRISVRNLAVGLALTMALEALLLCILAFFREGYPPETNPLFAFAAAFFVIAFPAYLIALPWAILQLGDPRRRKRDWVKNGALAGIVTGMVNLLIAMIAIAIRGRGAEDLPGAAIFMIIYYASGGAITGLIARPVTLSLQPRPE